MEHTQSNNKAHANAIFLTLLQRPMPYQDKASSSPGCQDLNWPVLPGIQMPQGEHFSSFFVWLHFTHLDWHGYTSGLNHEVFNWVDVIRDTGLLINLGNQKGY